MEHLEREGVWGVGEVGEKGRMSHNTSSQLDTVLGSPCSKKHNLKKFLAGLKQLLLPMNINKTIQTTFQALSQRFCASFVYDLPLLSNRIKEGRPLIQGSLFSQGSAPIGWRAKVGVSCSHSQVQLLGSKSLHRDLH